MWEVKEKSVTIYQVAHYRFENKRRAEIIAEVLNNPDKKVCDICFGNGKRWKAVSYTVDNGGEGQTDYKASYAECNYCNSKGYLVKKTDWIKE